MKTWAAQAAHHAAFTSGIGVSVVPVIGPGTLDGFAIGVLLAAACFAGLNVRDGAVGLPVSLLVARPARQRLRGPARRRPAGQATLAGQPAPERWQRTEESRPYADPEHPPARPDRPGPDHSAPPAAPASPAAQCAAGPTGNQPRQPRSKIRRRLDAFLADMVGDDQDDAGPGEAGPGEADEPDESFWGPQAQDEASFGKGYRSRHRLPGPTHEPKRTDGYRNMPRHAAPPTSFSARLAGLVTRTAL